MPITNKAFLLASVLCAHVVPACAKSSPASATAQAAPAAPTNGAKEQCARGAPEPVLIASKDPTKHQFERLGDHEARETTVLDDGTVLTIRHSGCAHYDLEFSFLLSGEKAATHSPSEWLTRAEALLGKVSIVPAQQTTLRKMRELLRGSAANPYTYGDGLTMSEMETVSVEVSAAAQGMRLAVLYDVAL